MIAVALLLAVAAGAWLGLLLSGLAAARAQSESERAAYLQGCADGLAMQPGDLETEHMRRSW